MGKRKPKHRNNSERNGGNVPAVSDDTDAILVEYIGPKYSEGFTVLNEHGEKREIVLRRGALDPLPIERDILYNNDRIFGLLEKGFLRVVSTPDKQSG